MLEICQFPFLVICNEVSNENYFTFHLSISRFDVALKTGEYEQENVWT